MQEKISTQRTAPPDPLRYNIALRLAGYSPTARIKIKKKILRRCGNIAESTLSRWLHLKQGDSADIPGKALHVFSDVLNCSMEDLLNKEKDKE